MADRGHIRATQFQRLDDTGFQLGVAELTAHAEQRRMTLASIPLPGNKSHSDVFSRE